MDVVLRLRTLEEQQARSQLVRARGEEREASDRLRERLEEHQNRPDPIGVLSPSELETLRLADVRSVESVTEAAAALEQAGRRADSASSEWQRRRMSLDGTRELEAGRRARAAYYAGLAAQRALDDLAAIRSVEGRA